MKILIAEDDSTSALVLRKSLEKLGHDVTVASDGMTAWNLLRGGGGGGKDPGTPQFEVLVSDWMMPEMDGLDLLRRIRGTAGSGASGEKAASGNGYLYVILLTAKGMPEDRLCALEAGADDFLVKPLDQGDLIARLEVARRILAFQQDAAARTSRVEHLEKQLQRQAQAVGEILISQGSITSAQLRHALDQVARTGQELGPILIANGWATDEDMTLARSVQIDVPFVMLSRETPDQGALDLVPFEVAEKHQMLPLSYRSDGVLRLAVVDPWNIEGIDTIQSLVNCRVEPLLTSDTAMAAALKQAYRDTERRRRDARLSASFERQNSISLLDGSSASSDVMYRSEDVDTDSGNADVDEAPIIGLINTLLSDGVRQGASDIHIEPYKHDFEIRYRIDGDMHVIKTLPRASLPATIGRIKIMAEMDIAERRLPQDGRIALKVGGKGVDLRVSSLPTQFGERLVLRVLDRSASQRTLDELGFAPSNRQRFDELIRHPHGIVLVTGPTGSGKTTTLYAALNALRSPSTNILTCEDPVEYELDRVGQSNINPKAGLTFAMQLKAILRQDPDVILVGEIRDAETAEIAFRAALTGHLVLSTLHCNEAVAAPTRLIEMGVPPFLISAALIGVVAQRLVKRLCPDCRREVSLTPDRQEYLRAISGRAPKTDTMFAPVGCEACNQTGMRGRFGVHEVLALNERMQTAIVREENTRVLRDLATEAGMTYMFHDGVEKAIQGLTTLEEVQRKLYRPDF
jgi:type IV pilus assembly protein PilB